MLYTYIQFVNTTFILIKNFNHRIICSVFILVHHVHEVGNITKFTAP